MRNSVICLCFAMLVGVVLTGCESAKNSEGLIIDPVSADMAGDGSTRWFTVIGKNDAANITSSNDGSSTTSTGTSTNDTSTTTITSNMALNDLSYPLEWSVSNPAMGTIIRSSGDTALYRMNAVSGHQVITVRDQYGNEGYASVYQ